MSKDAVQTGVADDWRRWPTLNVLCMGVLMVVLDGTVVGVALPSISKDLKLTSSSLTWLVNAYILTFGGALLLGGRLSDLYGQRRLFLIGTAFFTVASLVCGVANTLTLLLAARALQGFGGAVVVASALSLIMNMFTSDAERAKAMGIYSFVCASGGTIGLLLGGILTSAFNWHWIFLVNLPVGGAVYTRCLSLLPQRRARITDGQLDIWGAVAITTSLMLASYASTPGDGAVGGSAQTLKLLAAGGLFALFLAIEARSPNPLIPLSILRRRNLAISTVVCVLWTTSTCVWSFIAALYLQLVLGYGPMQVGLAFLPANVVLAAFSLRLSAKLVLRFGIRKPLCSGILISALGLALSARVPVNGDILMDVVPSMILVGIGVGIAFNPLLLVAMSDVEPSESGLAAGIVNTASLMGSGLGLAILANVSVARTKDLLASAVPTADALTGGYRLAVLLSAACAGTAALLGSAFLPTTLRPPTPEQASSGAAAPASTKE